MNMGYTFDVEMNTSLAMKNYNANHHIFETHEINGVKYTGNWHYGKVKPLGNGNAIVTISSSGEIVIE